MEHATKIKQVPLTVTPTSSSSTATITPPNPYARDPSRRAIACVTCAKAKTRCDKAVSASDVFSGRRIDCFTASIMFPLHHKRHQMRSAFHTTHNRQQLPLSFLQKAFRNTKTFSHARGPTFFEQLSFAPQHALNETAQHHACAFAHRLSHSSQDEPAGSHHVWCAQAYALANISESDRR